MQLGERIVSLRKEAKVSRTELSRRTGIAQSTLWGYETGGSIGSEQLLKIAAVFDVSVDYLLGITELRKGIRYLDEEFLISGDQRIKNSDIIVKLNNLTSENRAVINNTVDALLKL